MCFASVLSSQGGGGLFGSEHKRDHWESDQWVIPADCSTGRAGGGVWLSRYVCSAWCKKWKTTSLSAVLKQSQQTSPVGFMTHWRVFSQNPATRGCTFLFVCALKCTLKPPAYTINYILSQVYWTVKSVRGKGLHQYWVTEWPMTSQRVPGMGENLPCSINARPAPLKHSACPNKCNIGAQCVCAIVYHQF